MYHVCKIDTIFSPQPAWGASYAQAAVREGHPENWSGAPSGNSSGLFDDISSQLLVGAAFPSCTAVCCRTRALGLPQANPLLGQTSLLIQLFLTRRGGQQIWPTAAIKSAPVQREGGNFIISLT